MPSFSLSRRALLFFLMITLLSLTGDFATSHFRAAMQSDGPKANPENFCASPGNELKVTAARGTLANDSGTPLTIVANTNPANGTLKLNGDGSFSYTPKTGFTGTDTFTYTVSDSVQAFRMTPSVLSIVNGISVQGDGYGSSIAPVPGVANEFYGLTDRGPNVDGPNGSKVFPLPDFNPKIGHFKIENGAAQLVGVITLSDSTGKARTGLPNPPGPGNTGEVALDLAGKTLPFDAQGIDSEGLAALPDGTFWVSDEYGPYIVHFDGSGRTLEQITPFNKNSQGHKLPSVLAKRVPNRGMEGLTITPDGMTLVGMMQTSLTNDIVQADAQRTALLRIVTLNLATGETHQYAYLLEDPITTGTLSSEITAISNTEFLVDERDGKFPLDPSTTPQIKKVWQISLTGATDISDPSDSDKGLLAGGKTLEALVSRLTTSQALSTLAANNIKPVSKTLKVDLIALFTSLNPAGKFFPHDKIEGIALIDGGKKLVVSDDSDFGVLPTNPVSLGLAAKTLPTTGDLDYGEILIVDLAKLPARTSTATVTITVGDTQPPVITTPANLTAITSSPADACAVVNFSVKASDNCGTVDVTTNPPSGTCFPLGVTTVMSSSTDQAGNKATASFKITVWDGALQDDNSGALLLFNSRTGDYSFSACSGGAAITGKARVTRIGCQTSLNDSKLNATFERCSYSSFGHGRAIFRPTPLGTTFIINDSNTADNSITCH